MKSFKKLENFSRVFLAAAISSVISQSALSQSADKERIESIVVTGSRIVRDGMTASTPVSVIGADRLDQRAATSIGDALNELPAFRATQTPATGASNGYVGGRILDLRGLGAVRTLVLVDSKRFVPSTTVGTVDTNLVPSNLLERAEVVTGGASAAYGSDAVAGVVNFILNEKLMGFRSSVEYGQTEYSDNKSYTAKFAGGLSILDGRGHFIGGAEYENNKGIGFCTARDWCAEEWLNFGRPNLASGLPANNILPNIRPSTISDNAVINAPTALKGISFNADGSPRLFEYGSYVNTLFMVGGENKNNKGYFPLPIRSPSDRYSLYTRTKYDFSENLIGRLDVSFGSVSGESAGRELLNTSYTIKSGNPFIPTSANKSLDINSIMSANKLTSFTLGKNFDEYGPAPVISKNDALRIVTSLNGALSGSWKWDAYYQYGHNNFISTTSNLGITARVTRALDAVKNSTGQIVCGVNSDAITTNDDPACVALNPFGRQASAAAGAYVLGSSVQTNITKEHVFSGNLSGELLSGWAGPVSLAAGIEYRTDKIGGEADAISQSLGFVTNNASLIDGKINVTEGYLETVVPLARDLSFAKDLELNAAVRSTSYDRSGSGLSSTTSVTTWKVGTVWQPIEALRFRITKSRDIRAPNISELYGPKTTGFGILNDPAKGGAQGNPVVTSGSNASLIPEVADTTTYGFVIKPGVDGAFGRMQLSLDYYDIGIKDAIGVLGAQTIATRCFEGATEFCSSIVRDSAGFITQINDSRKNVDKLITKGYDIEFSYRHPLDTYGDLDFRLLATYVDKLITIDSAGPTDRAGQTGLRAGTIPGMPRYTIDTMMNWTFGPLQLSLHGRYIPAGRYNVAFIGPYEPGYNIALGNSSNSNSVPSAWYADLVGQFDFSKTSDGSLIGYAAINNINDQDPPRVPGSNGSGNNVMFDPVGRMYKFGVRMTF